MCHCFMKFVQVKKVAVAAATKPKTPVKKVKEAQNKKIANMKQPKVSAPIKCPGHVCSAS